MSIKKLLILFLTTLMITRSQAQADSVVTDKDRKKDVLLSTSKGDILIRLSDSTPLHRDNFLKLVKMHYYDGLLFHRVINQFMIQSGDPESRNALPGVHLGEGGLPYTVPAEFRQSLFHKKGMIAAARDNNPQKASSATQFYLTQGKVFTDEQLDELIQKRLGGRPIPPEQREVYKTIGGIPHLDQSYTVFGEVISGIEVIDEIAKVPTSTNPTDKDRPIDDVRIFKAKLVKRKKVKHK